MNALTTLFSTHLPRPQHHGIVLSLARPAKRERDFGIGYGSSSGYAQSARYAPAQPASRFRFG